jgi:CRP/FNR family cyclic AMP-dependent transcriptional regulator
MQTVEDLLREAPLFGSLADDQLALVAGCGSNVHIDENAVLFREGDAAEVFYLIREGVAALETFAPARGAITIETLEEGEVIGWSWLFPPYRWHFDARAITPIRATVFDGACLRGKCEADPVLGFELMSRFAQVLIERLQWTRLRLLDVYGDDRPR